MTLNMVCLPAEGSTNNAWQNMFINSLPTSDATRSLGMLSQQTLHPMTQRICCLLANSSRSSPEAAAGAAVRHG